MNILVINCGSSSIKFQLYKMPGEILLVTGKADKSGEGEFIFSFDFQKNSIKRTQAGYSYLKVINEILFELINPENECLNSLDEINVVGHRLIHGGETGKECSEITPGLIAYMKASVSLAPLHYPANLEGIKSVAELMPETLQFGVFDTAFHQTIPQKAFLYGIPKEWYSNHKIRRYGFHGTSHKFVFQRACKLAGISQNNSKVITCHLGNGSSVTAIKNGKSVDTSMGMTPVEGLLMGTRSGDIDAGALIYIQENFNKSAKDIQQIINKNGGLLGLSGVSGDYRKVLESAKNGDTGSQVALDVFYYRIKKYIGAYIAALGGLDALVFTGGIGENSNDARKEICEGFEFFGILFSKVLNEKVNGTEAIISDPESQVKVIVVPTNEELMIAREVYDLAKSKL